MLRLFTSYCFVNMILLCITVLWSKMFQYVSYLPVDTHRFNLYSMATHRDIVADDSSTPYDNARLLVRRPSRSHVSDALFMKAVVCARCTIGNNGLWRKLTDD